MSQLEHFERLAPRYDELRTPGEVTPLHELLVREGDLAGRRVLDIGCGTGAMLAILAGRFGSAVAGVDPSPRMLREARGKLRDADLQPATAERLPFPAETFDAALMVVVVHHVDRPRAFDEARRVLVRGGRFLIVTRDPAAVVHDWPARLFPSYVELSQSQFPAPDLLEAELRAAGFSSTRRRDLSVPRRFSREAAVAKLRGRYSSTLDLLPEDEYRNGVEQAERELPEVLEYQLEWAIVVAERD